jgi:predicted metal-dependent phosphoesterase TrpH
MKAIKKIMLTVLFMIIPLLLQASEFQVKVINSENDLPEKFCSHWAKGDYLIFDGKNLTLIGGAKRPLKNFSNYPGFNAMGSIISFVPARKKMASNLNIGSPYIRIRKKREYLTYNSIKPLKKTAQKEALAFEAIALYESKKGKKAQIRTLYHFSPLEGRIDISSTITNTGKKEFEDLNYSLYFSAFHDYDFSPFDREDHPDLRFRVYQKKGHYLAWLNMNPLTEKEKALEDEEESPPLPGTLAPKEVFEVRRALLVDTQHENLLQKIYEIFNVEPEEALIHFEEFNGGSMEVIVRDAFSSSVFFRSFLENPSSISIPLPRGVYRARANFFPAVREKLLSVGLEEENSCTLKNPPQGKVKVKIVNSRNEFVPGKVTFIGLSPTETPYFRPENPVKSGRAWESSKNSCFPQEKGKEVKLPVGTYLISASRGPEYSMDKKVVEILQNEQQELIFSIDRVLKTPNLISIDPHMHTHNSDGYMPIPERIKSVVAEGVDVAVATDHNYITDYYPVLKKLGLNKYLAVIKGNEITVSGLIHYNAYALKHRPAEEGNGAIYPVAEESSPLFEASRKKDPGAILQVNHPRSGRLGYFNTYQLDLESAAFAREHFDTSFDVLEVMNGPILHSSNLWVIKDWLHLLNRGYYFPLVASSDSHSIDRDEPGYCRTYVMYEGEEGDNLNWEALAIAIKKGRSFASNGPLVEFKVNGKYHSGDFFTATEGKAEVWIKVQSAPWVAVDEVRLIVNGERKIILPVKAAKEDIQKFAEQISLKLKKDSYIAVEVLGKKSLYPILQRRSSEGLFEDATLPYALTNPVFIDVDGNGKFDPPLPGKIKLRPDLPEPIKYIERYE